MLGAAAMGNHAGKSEENKIAPRLEGGRQTVLRNFDGDVPRERRIRDLGERGELDEMVLAEPVCPARAQIHYMVEHARSRQKLGRIPLAIVEADGFDPEESFERPGEADCRILPAGE